ncbi:unnamed protein product [Danaus chrysippus]|uniref:(African queen) hypothetical protein n=1 Tax=Danaus chrysippus TaxID=151541 RepID=A0A8J2W0V2_9NEOP|nr:unnamed protein product [Danaus chrysippus]
MTAPYHLPPNIHANRKICVLNMYALLDCRTTEDSVLCRAKPIFATEPVRDNVIKSPKQRAGLTSLLLRCPHLGIMDHPPPAPRTEPPPLKPPSEFT